ncbi:MAG: hypothetical protein ABSA68_02570 [Xanthobacteraceae bacterium]|jgi:hypothetical protein
MPKISPVQALVAKANRARQVAKSAERELVQRYGFAPAQVKGMLLAPREPENFNMLAVAFADAAIRLRQPRSMQLRRNALMAHRKGSIF